MIGRIAIVLICVVIAGCAGGHGKPTALYPIEKDGKWGYIDKTGRVIVEPKYDIAYRFSEGFAFVNVGGKRDRKVGFKGGKWGVIDTTGRVVIKPKYDGADGFSEGLAAVRIGDKWGYIDCRGRIVIEPRYDAAYSFNGGMAVGHIHSDSDSSSPLFVEVIDRFGKPLTKKQPTIVYQWGVSTKCPSEGLLAAEKDGKWGYIDSTGAYVIPPRFTAAAGFCNGLARVSDDSGSYFIDKTGKKAFDDTYGDGPFVHRFSEGFAGVLDPPVTSMTKTKDVEFHPSADRKWGYIDKTGRMAIKPQFDEVWDFHEGLACVGWDVRYVKKKTSEGKPYWDRTGRWGFIDKTGMVAFKLDHEVTVALGFHEGFTPVATGPREAGGKWGYVDKTGRMVVKPRFTDALPFEDGIAFVAINDKWGYIDKTGKYIWKPTK